MLDLTEFDLDRALIPGSIAVHAAPRRGVIVVEMIAEDGASMACDLTTAQATELILGLIGAAQRCSGQGDGT
jgi:hypothetical protein